MNARDIISLIYEARTAISIEQLKRQINNFFGERLIYKGHDNTGLAVSIPRDLVPEMLTDRPISPYIRADSFDRIVLKNSGWKTVKSGFSLGDYTLTFERSKSEGVSKPRYLYHVTSENSVSLILRKGLIPKIQGSDIGLTFRFPEPRTYVFTEYSKRVVKDIWRYKVPAKQFHATSRDQFRVAVFRIDTKKFDRFNLYSDDRMIGDDAAWTSTHIPRHAVELMGMFKLADIPDSL